MPRDTQYFGSTAVNRSWLPTAFQKDMSLSYILSYMIQVSWIAQQPLLWHLGAECAAASALDYLSLNVTFKTVCDCIVIFVAVRTSPILIYLCKRTEGLCLHIDKGVVKPR